MMDFNAWAVVVVAIFGVLILVALEFRRSWRRTRHMQWLEGLERARKAFYEAPFLDGQGNKVRVGVAYKYCCGHGDITTIVVEDAREDGTASGYDVEFKMALDSIKTSMLWRPLMHKWDAHPGSRDAVIDYAGESALSLD